ncbi:MAG: DUF72 domain-containing protein [Chitinophagaceae bacterium]
MDFGKIPIDELDSISFKLPPDTVLTKQTLINLKPVAKPPVYIGCAKWGRKEWVGNLYPAKTKEKDFLSNYVQHFNSVELNAMHYKLYDEETVAAWSSLAGDRDFKFCPKMVRSVTHFSTLISPKAFEITGKFLTSVMAFGKHLGPVFIQLSDRFSPKRKENLFTWLKTLPGDVDFFVELRHPEWFSDKTVKQETFGLLNELGIGAVITDTAGRRDCLHMNLTIPKVFIRFVGNNLHPTDYTRVDKWIARLKKWRKDGLKEIYFFLHQPDEINTPAICDYMRKHLQL